MILLIFAVLSLTLISLWLVNELVIISKVLQEEKEMSEMRRNWADTYWKYYCEACSDKRDLKRELEELRGLYEGKTILAESLDERVEELLDEIERLNEQNKWLQYELENEFEWSMLYSESADRLAGELEQTQETLNMLEHGYELLQHKSEQWKKDLKYYREKYEGNYDPIE